MIHVEDMAQSVILAVDRRVENAAFNVVDDEPLRQRELYAYLARRSGAPDPQRTATPTKPASQRCSNARTKETLGFRPKYPSFREGWTARIE